MICHVIPSDGPGGLQATVYQLLAADSMQVAYPLKLWRSGLSIDADPISSTHRGEIRRLLALRVRLKSAARHSEVTIVGWGYHGALVALALSVSVRSARIIWSIRQTNPFLASTNPLSWVIACVLSPLSRLNRVENIVYCSSSAQEFHSLLGYSREKSMVVENTYSGTGEVSGAYSSRTKAERSPSSYTVATSGRDTRVKRFPLFISAMSHLPEFLHGKPVVAKIFVVGSQIDVRNLQKNIPPRMKKRILVVAHTSSKWREEARSISLFISLSSTEGRQNAVLDALHAGSPVLLNRARHNHPWLAAGAIFLTNLRPKNIAKTVVNILSSPDELTRCEENGKHYLAQQPANSSVEKWLGLLPKIH